MVTAQTNPSGGNRPRCRRRARPRSARTRPARTPCGAANHRRPAALLPGELHALAPAVPADRHRPGRARQRAMLGRVGGKLVHDQAERLHRLRPQIAPAVRRPRTCRRRSRRTARAGPAAAPPASPPANRAGPVGRANRRAPGCSRAAASRNPRCRPRAARSCGVSPCTTASMFLVRCDSSRSVKARCSSYWRRSVMSRCTAATPTTRCAESKIGAPLMPTGTSRPSLCRRTVSITTGSPAMVLA